MFEKWIENTTEIHTLKDIEICHTPHAVFQISFLKILSRNTCKK